MKKGIRRVANKVYGGFKYNLRHIPNVSLLDYAFLRQDGWRRGKYIPTSTKIGKTILHALYALVFDAAVYAIWPDTRDLTEKRDSLTGEIERQDMEKKQRLEETIGSGTCEGY